MELKTSSRHRTYSRPPIWERVAKIWADITEEEFLSRFESWREQVQLEYPSYEPHKEWLVTVTEKDGVPLFDTLQPELRLTHRFAKKSKDGRREFGMRCPPDSLDLHLFTQPDVPHGYAALAAEFGKWIPRWMRHFSVTNVKRLRLYYSNLLGPQTVGPFVTRDSGLELHKLLNVFLTIPGQHDAIIPPYDSVVTVALTMDPPTSLSLRIHGDLDFQPQPAVWVDFSVNVEATKKGLDTDDVIRSFDVAHERILDRFDLMFTDAAKRFFSGE